ncbi:MAG: hypothetical protein PWQ87_845 [Candidatus Woesearchaeota archaeon]|nr:hypothetical protein [Candidatus Woesearchaeota archaeon]
MEEISLDDLMRILNERLNNIVPFIKRFDVFLQKGGVGCYDVKRWAIFIPDSLNNFMKIHTILHEGAHLILREKLSNLISPEGFDRLKWSMEPFFIENSVFSLDEAFAEIVTTKIMCNLPEAFLNKKIVFNKFSEPSYEDSDKKLDIFLAKISKWQIPITLKNNNLNISNTMKNLTFLEPEDRVKAILDSLSVLRDYKYEEYIKKIIDDPLKNSPSMKLLSSIFPSMIKINEQIKDFDKQIFLDYLENLSWIDYDKDYYIYSKFIDKKNVNKIKKQKNPKINTKIKEKFLKISKNLKETRERIKCAWEARDGKKLKMIIGKYNSERWKYREKVNLKNNFNKYGFGLFKWE